MAKRPGREEEGGSRLGPGAPGHDPRLGPGASGHDPPLGPEASTLDPQRLPDEPPQERSLRPGSLADFIGQASLKDNLAILIGAARKRGDPLEHLLFYGPPGLGKTTLAHLLAHEMDVPLVATSGPALERAGDLVGLLTSLTPRGILFVDEIHRIPRVVEEYLYSAMEDGRLDIVLDRGPAARSVRLNLVPFTLVGATTRVGLLTAPLRGRFGYTGHLDFYPPEELRAIVERAAGVLRVVLDEESAALIAGRARGTPRIANRLLRRVRDLADVQGAARVTPEITRAALAMLRIDERGLHEMDRRLLEALVLKFNGGPVGLGTLAAVLGEEEDTLEDLLEPYLMQQGYLERTRRGRAATRLAFEALGVDPGRAQERLL
ncbi:MAG: Holliday junction branch migration DNA helicase RuvB [Candidatus Eisenbacteria bacterium]|uniref:Holliday junction branch migration complex subunit RuvB n=1 Tax=Eiseniibacteriota bacterium TaxID=2212470 RepID=A0A937X838_UNCEI|nr:Holliday junction branch migration DNA helicase RuvB [Candidatus Eisenbacteria bacterium]